MGEGPDAGNSVTGEDLFNMSVELINRYNAVNQQKRDFGTGVPLSVAELHLIDAISRAKPATAAQIARDMGITKGAVSQMLPRLERKGLVVRTPSATDGRAADVSLTALGSTAVDHHEDIHQQLLATFQQAAGQMPERSRRDTAMLINAISTFLDSLQSKGKDQQ